MVHLFATAETRYFMYCRDSEITEHKTFSLYGEPAVNCNQ